MVLSFAEYEYEQAARVEQGHRPTQRLAFASNQERIHP